MEAEDSTHSLPMLDELSAELLSVVHHYVPVMVGLGYTTIPVADATLHYWEFDSRPPGPNGEPRPQRSWAAAIVELVENLKGGLTRDGKPFLHRGGDKDRLPYAVPAMGKVGTKGRSYDDLIGMSAVMLDLDAANVGLDALTSALRDLGLEAAYWPTFSSVEGAERWRVSFPLATPAPMEGWAELVRGVWSRLERALRYYGVQDPALDEACTRATQAALLPILPHDDDHALALLKAGWGGLREIFEVRGRPLAGGGLSLMGRRTLSLATLAQRQASRSRAKTREQWAEVKGPKAKGGKTPLCGPGLYAGQADSERARTTVRAWAAEGMAYTPELAGGIDGVALLRAEGFAKRSPRESRHMALTGAIWAMHRAGWSTAQMEEAIGEIADKSGDKVILDKGATFLTQIGKKIKLASTTYAKLIVLKPDDARYAAFAAVIARSEHCRHPAGGKLRQSQIAELLGLGTRPEATAPIRAWLDLAEKAGIIEINGELQHRTYRLLA